MESFDEGRVGPGELGVTAIFDGFNKDGTGINLDHDHDVVIACLGAVGKFSSLVSEDGVAGVVHLGEDVPLLAALELRGPEILQGDGFWLGGKILLGLVEVTLWRFDGFGVILMHVAQSE